MILINTEEKLNMKCEKYNDLVKDLKFKNSEGTMKILNERIENAIDKLEEPMLYYEELICYLKKEEALVGTYTFLSIAYAILVGTLSIILTKEDIGILILLGIACVIIVVIAIVSMYRNRKQWFVLNLLMLRYEKLKGKNK